MTERDPHPPIAPPHDDDRTESASWKVDGVPIDLPARPAVLSPKPKAAPEPEPRRGGAPWLALFAVLLALLLGVVAALLWGAPKG